MTDPISAIVPARDEAATIAAVVAALRGQPAVGEVLVVDNGSRDGTGASAARAGARVIAEPRPGMGHAVRAGLAAARHDWVLKADADLAKFDGDLVTRLMAARGPGTGLVKGDWTDPGDDMPMTRLLVRPALAQVWPGLAHLAAPNSGIYLIDRSCIAVEELRGDYAADLDAMIRVHCAGRAVTEARIGHIAHDRRDPGHYAAMASVILGFVLERRDAAADEALVIRAPGAAAVIAGGLGLAAARLRAGGRVALCLDGEDAATGALRAALARFPRRISSPRRRWPMPWPGRPAACALPVAGDARGAGAGGGLGARDGPFGMPVDGAGRPAAGFRAALSLPSSGADALAAAIAAGTGIATAQPADRALLAPAG